MIPTNKKTTFWILITLTLALASVVAGANVPNQQDTSPQLLETSLASDFNASNPIETTMHKGGGGGGGKGGGGSGAIIAGGAGGGHGKSGAGRIAVGEPLVLVLGAGVMAFAAAGAL